MPSSRIDDAAGAAAHACGHLRSIGGRMPAGRAPAVRPRCPARTTLTRMTRAMSTARSAWSSRRSTRVLPPSRPRSRPDAQPRDAGDHRRPDQRHDEHLQQVDEQRADKVEDRDIGDSEERGIRTREVSDAALPRRWQSESASAAAGEASPASGPRESPGCAGDIRILVQRRGVVRPRHHILGRSGRNTAARGAGHRRSGAPA